MAEYRIGDTLDLGSCSACGNVIVIEPDNGLFTGMRQPCEVGGRQLALRILSAETAGQISPGIPDGSEGEKDAAL